MPRRARIQIPGLPLHIVQRGHNRSDCFHSDGERLYYLNLVADRAKATGCAVHAYVLMTNHVHLLVSPDGPGSASSFMKQTSQQYAQFINKAYSRRGTPWEGRFRSSVVQSEEYLLACHRYIELNPVRAKLVRRAADYRWSSYRRNALGESSAFIQPHEVYMRLGSSPHERQCAYRGLFGTLGDDAGFARIRRAILGGYAVGVEGFAEQVGEIVGRPAFPRKAGRPKRSGN